ncbi:MAG TPA: GNVR domain-containing protein [Candidatus Eisenbacteria bacterium]|nr:GNVR domain-containing protein [Candidatus Eisenbacteria bacterium]
MADRSLPHRESESEQIVASLRTVYRTRRPLLLACVLGVVLPVLAFNELATPVFEAESSLVFEELTTPVASDLTTEAAREYQLFNRIEEMNSLAFAEDIARALPDSLRERIPPPKDEEARKLGDPIEHAGVFLHEGLRASPLRNTNVVRVRARTNDAELSMAVANLAPLVLEERGFRIRREGAKGLKSYVDDQLSSSKARLQESEEQLRNYKQSRGVSSLEGESAETLRKLTEAEIAFNTTRADRRAAEQRLAAVRQTVTSQRGQLVPSVTNTSARATQGLKEKLVVMEGQYAQLSVQGYSPDHPRMSQLRQEIAEGKRTLAEEATRVAKTGSTGDPIGNIEVLNQEAQTLQLQVQSLRARENALSRAVGQYRGMLSRLPGMEIELARLTRERDANHKTYTSLLDNRETIRGALANQVPNSRVVDWAQLPEDPIFPQKPLNLALGLALGLMLGTGIGLHLESGRSNLRNMLAFEDQMGWEVLARVPASKIGSSGRLSSLAKKDWDASENDSRRALVSHSDPASAAGEAYFMLRTRLELLGLGTKYRSLMVTSTAPRDGKSSTLCNLAATFGAAGRSALVVDAELRRPVIHRYFGVNQWPGLSDILVARTGNGNHPHGYVTSPGSGNGNGSRSSELFQPTGVDGVTVLACGKRVSEIEWESTRPLLGPLLQELRTEYDVLLVDSAPPTLVHDTLALCSLVDAVVVVVNTANYDTQRLLETKRLLERAGANIIGCVINRVEPYGTYSYYYDRRYSPREPGDSPLTSRA